MPSPTRSGMGIWVIVYAFAVQYSTCFARTSGLRYLIKYQVPMLIMNRPLIGPTQLPLSRRKFIVSDSTPSIIHNVPAIRGRRGTQPSLPPRVQTTAVLSTWMIDPLRMYFSICA